MLIEGHGHTFSTNAHLVLRVVLQETLDTAAGKLILYHESAIKDSVLERRQRLGACFIGMTRKEKFLHERKRVTESSVFLGIMRRGPTQVANMDMG